MRKVPMISIDHQNICNICGGPLIVIENATDIIVTDKKGKSIVRDNMSIDYVFICSNCKTTEKANYFGGRYVKDIIIDNSISAKKIVLKNQFGYYTKPILNNNKNKTV